jgi:hypothetical protein
MIYLSTGVVHGRRLPISRADIGALQKQIGRRYVAWITKRGRLVAFDLVTGRLRVLARSARFSPFFLQGSLIAWQRADDDSVHAADLRTGRRLAVSQAWCARETYDCSLVGIAPGGMLALDVLHSNREDTALLWEELALERPA